METKQGNEVPDFKAGYDCGLRDARETEIRELNAALDEVKRLRGWVEEAISYVGCPTWSPSLEAEGRKLLAPNVELTGTKQRAGKPE